jgi:predicted phosphodiesterase
VGAFDPVAELRELERRHGLERANLELQARLHSLERVRALERSLASHDGPRTHLVIGDSHAHPEVARDHYRWLGRMVADLEPEVVIDIGDWFDMDSLNPYDKGKKCFEGRRYWRDIEAGLEAQELYREGLDGYVPQVQGRTTGNHENRSVKILQYEPALADLVGPQDRKSAEYGWQEIPFLEPFTVDGVSYVHYYEGTASQRAISGVVPARAVLLKKHVSSVFGHSHRLGYFEENDGHGRRICVLNTGCYFPQHAQYAGKDNDLWRRGIAVLHDVHNGEFDLDWTSYDWIRRRYGG